MAGTALAACSLLAQAGSLEGDTDSQLPLFPIGGGQGQPTRSVLLRSPQLVGAGLGVRWVVITHWKSSWVVKVVGIPAAREQDGSCVEILHVRDGVG